MEHCHDCGVVEGELHELGCDMEWCPFCGRQLIFCGCCHDLLKTDDELTEEQEEQWWRFLMERGRVPFIVYPNMCARCGALWPEMFNVPDEEWNRYVEIQHRKEMLCKSCYDQIRIWIDNAASRAERREYDRKRRLRRKSEKAESKAAQMSWDFKPQN
jgi:hypothetical protein